MWPGAQLSSLPERHAQAFAAVQALNLKRLVARGRPSRRPSARCGRSARRPPSRFFSRWYGWARRRVRILTRRSRGVSLEQMVKQLASYLRGWRGYFGFCETSTGLRGWQSSKASPDTPSTCTARKPKGDTIIAKPTRIRPCYDTCAKTLSTRQDPFAPYAVTGPPVF